MEDKDVRLLAHSLRGGVIGDVTEIAHELQIERAEGPIQATWILDYKEMEPDKNYGLFRSWFGSRMLYPISVTFNNYQAWYGRIFEMELSLDDRIIKASMQKMANTIIAQYSRKDGDTANDVLYTDWVEDQVSIDIYGRRESVINVNTESEDEAIARAKGMLKRLHRPHMSPPQFVKVEKPNLRCTAVGNAQLANGLLLLRDRVRYHPDYADISNGDDTTVGAEIKRIVDFIDYQSGWLYVIDIAANDTPTKIGVPSTVGAWDRVKELALVPNQNEQEYELLVEDDGGVIYQKKNVTRAKYFVMPYPKGIERTDGETPKWDAVAESLKVLDTSLEPVALPDGLYSDPSIIQVDRVIMQDGREVAEFYNKEVDGMEDFAAIDQNKNWIESFKEE